MNKQQFISILKEQLKGIPEVDKKEVLFDYEEHFEIGLREGRREEEIASSLGNPKSLAKEIRANYMINKVEESFTAGNFFRAFLSTLGLGFFNLVFILGPFAGIAAALFSLVVAGIAIVGSGIFVIVASFFPNLFQNVPSPFVGSFVGISLASFGVLWTIGSMYLNKWFYLLTIKYLKFNLNIIVNRRNKNE